MTFDDILDQAIEMLQRRKRLSYRALKRQFDLDDDYLEDLKLEIVKVQQLAVDQDGEMLVWTGESETKPESVSAAQPDQAEPQPITEQVQPAHIQTPSIEVPVPDAAERRQLTVMFCDLVDSTKLSGQLDPEDLRTIVRAYQKTCTDVIQRYDGHVAQLLGDGLLVYFGYPQAHEDDAQRAIRTGMGIVEAIDALNTRLERDQGIKLAVRLGIHTGLVVIGGMGSEGRQEQLALGETPNVASRIQGLAEPNTVVMSSDTYRLTQGYFDCESLGEQTLRGVDQPLNVYRVLSESGAQGRLDIASTRGLTPLIGREQEVGLLLERWNQVQEGSGQVVLLSGEAGIGKSRLVQILKDHVTDEPHTRWECRSSPYYQNTALYPIIDLIQRTLRFQPDDTPVQRLEKLEHNLSQYRIPVEETVLLFASLVSLAIPEDRYPPLNLTPQRQRQKTLESIVAIMLELAERQPLLFILDDAHWTDPTTLELLDLLIAQVPTAHIYTLITYRPEFQPTWGNRSYLSQLTLNRLSQNQIERMAEQVSGGKGLPVEVIQQLVDKSDGVPLYVEEMTKAVLESGVLKDVNGQYELVGSITALAIPATLQDSLMARLDRLVTAKGLAQQASVIGRQFSYELLQAISQLDAATLQRELGRLVEAELVYQRGLPPHATYLFKHSLLQDTAYESLLRSTRQQFHRRIAEVLEERFPATVETQPELLAHHTLRGEVWDKALRYYQQAGKNAMEQSASQEAVVCYEQALHALQYLPDTQATREQAIDVRLALRIAYQVLGEYEKILPYLREAEALAKALDDPHRLGQALADIASYFTMTMQPLQALTSANQALALAEASQDFSLQVHARFRVAVIHRNLGNYRQAIRLLTNNINVLAGDLQYEMFGGTTSQAVVSRYMLIYCHNTLGQFQASKRLQTEAVEIAETMHHPVSLTYAYGGASSVYIMQGDVQQAIPLLERLWALCQTYQIVRAYEATLIALSLAYALAQRPTAALECLKDVMPGRSHILLINRPAFIETLFLLGRVDEALTDAAEALDKYPSEQFKVFGAETFRLLGDIYASRSPCDIGKAKGHYDDALALADELGMRPLQAHCHRGLGTLYSQTGHVEQARAELSTAIEMYRDMEMMFWLPVTEAKLAEVEGY